jgi:4-hydroxy-4-methyl-2-oxoglutarate aldolase
MDLEELSRRLHTAVLSDVLDSMGLRAQCPDIQLLPITGHSSLVGYAKTLQWEDFVGEDEDPYGMLIKAVDSIIPGEIVVSVAGGSGSAAIWGELLSTATRVRGGRGAIVDGAVRDIEQMRAMDFPCFAREWTPRDSADRLKVVLYDVPVEVGGVTLDPGDFVMVDADGMVVIPSEVGDEVISSALEKIEKEDITRRELLKGRLLGDVYREYGVL